MMTWLACVGFADLNVQHAQVLVFLFHCLPMMQKKTLLVRVSLLLPPIAKKELLWLTEQSPLGVTRILLFVDYFLHHFYDPPALLTEQVQFNLLQVFAQPLNNSNGVTIKYCSFQPKDSPKNYNGDAGKAQSNQINGTSNHSSYCVLFAPGTTQPTFYNLAPALSLGKRSAEGGRPGLQLPDQHSGSHQLQRPVRRMRQAAVRGHAKMHSADGSFQEKLCIFQHS